MMQKQHRPSGQCTKITKISIVDQVCDAIKQDVVNGVWKTGDKLPSEAEFAASFGVNRLSVRMALQKLNTLGIITTRVGEGSFVCDFSLKPILNELTVFYEGEERYEEVTQLRRLLEYECLSLAVQNSTTQDQAMLKSALDHFKDVWLRYYENLEDTNLLEQLVDADFLFHCRIVEMSHNTLYRDIYHMVQQLIRSHIARLLHMNLSQRHAAGLPPLGNDDPHCKMYRSIVNADTTLLRQITDEMLALTPIECTESIT